MQNAILYLLCVLIWGSTWYVQKFQIGPVDPLLSVSYRFAIAGGLIVLYGIASGRFRNIAFTLGQWLHLVLLSFLMFFLQYWLFYSAAALHVTSGLIAVCFSTIPILNAINQRIFFKMRIKKQILLGGALGMTGIFLVFWHEIAGLHLSDTRIHGLGLALFAGYIASLGNISSMRNSRAGMPVFETTGLGMLLGSAFAFATALTTGIHINFDISPHYLASLAYLALFGSVVAFLSYLTLVARMGSDKAGYIGILTPIVALAISTHFEGYVWTSQAAIGVALILLGNVIALRKS